MEKQKTHTITINLKCLLTWNDKFEFPDGSYSVSDIQDYFLKRVSFKRGMEKILINHQYKYMQIKLKIALHLKLKMGIP